MTTLKSRKRLRKLIQRCVYEISDFPLTFFASMRYKTHFEGIENIPEEGPCLIVPKHCYLLDPLFVGKGLRSKPHILPDYLMRKVTWFGSNLPSWVLSLAGGKEIYKPRVELKGIDNKEEKNKIKENGRLNNSIVEEEIFKELSNKGYVVNFAEGIRMPGKMFPEDVKKSGRVKGFESKYFKLAEKVQNETGLEVSFLPVGLEYILNFGLRRHEVHIRFGEPLHYTEEAGVAGLVSECYDAVKRLSNL